MLWRVGRVGGVAAWPTGSSRVAVSPAPLRLLGVAATGRGYRVRRVAATIGPSCARGGVPWVIPRGACRGLVRRVPRSSRVPMGCRVPRGCRIPRSSRVTIGCRVPRGCRIPRSSRVPRRSAARPVAHVAAVP